MLRLEVKPTFAGQVSIPTPDGPVEVSLTFRHRTRKGLAEFTESAAKMSDVDLLMEILCGWEGVDRPFSREAVEVLCDLYHAAPRTILEQYLKLLTQARLGN